LASDAIQDVHPAGFSRLGDPPALLTRIFLIEENHWVRGVIIPYIMVNLLEVPAIFAAVDVQRDDGDTEQVVAFTQRTVEHRPGIAGGEIDHTQRRVYCRCLPDGGASVLPDITVLRPGIVTELS